MQFCTGCGRPLTDAVPVVQEERRRISVLFIDVVGFTPYTERIDPEQVRIMQNDYFSSVRRIVRQYGGVVEKYIGDAVMVLFGAPVATEADALRSVRAGLELQRVLPQQGRAREAGLRFRVGIATGEALVNLTAAHDGGQAIVAGDLVNTASRLQSAAPTDGVLTDEGTYLSTKNEIEYVAQPTTQLKGRSQVSNVWLAVAPRPPRPAGAESEQTPMVDREHELALLVNALRRTVTSRVPQLVTIFGAAGIGKSRLLRELARHAGRITGENVCWRVGQCRPFGENVTYAALADIVKSQAGILDTDDEDTTRQRLTDALHGLTNAEDAQRLGDALGPLVGLTGARITPGEAEAAWRRFIVRFSSGQATVLVFEDLHWADETMLRFIESLAAATRRIPLLIVCTARPELRERYPQWTSAMTGTTSISLPPMRESDISTMYSLMFGKAAFTPDLLAPLVELADGNPLYAHEYVRMLVDRGSLRPTGPGWKLDEHEASPMPDNVRAVIANRLDLLDPADRAVLQAAAVVGMQFWPGAVATAVGRPVEEVERTLLRLEQRDLVEERGNSSMAGQLEYAFRHVLVRDVCYQRLPRAERVARHERTADWLERVSAGRQTDLAEVLANHRWAAHEIARTLGLDPGPYASPAREALLRAARRAYSLHALDAAQELVRRASTLLASPDPAVDLFASELAFFRDADAFLESGGEERLTTLAHLLQDTGRLDGAGRAWTLLGSAALSRADRPACLAYLARAIALYEKLPPSEEAALALLEYARVHMIDYETATAIAAADTAAEAANRLGLAEVRANALITSAVAQYLQGEQEGLHRLQEITLHCREQQLTSLRRAIHNLGFAMQEEGDITGSQKLIDEFTPLEAASGLTLATNFADAAARAYFAGDWAVALRAAADSMRAPTIEWDLHMVAQAGWIRVLRASPAESVEDPVEEAVQTARRSGFHKVIRSTLAHAALCRALQHREAEAGALLDELAADYGDSRTFGFAEWVVAAAYAAWLLGPARAAQVRTLLERSPRRTPWVDAAILTCAATVDGTPAGHRGALDILDRIGAVSDQALARAALVRALRAGGRAAEADEALTDLTTFSTRNNAPGLLLLTEP